MSNPIKSQPLNAPFVRVRGRLSREGVVKWSPCLRTFRSPTWASKTRGDDQASMPSSHIPAAETRLVARTDGGVPDPHRPPLAAAHAEPAVKGLELEIPPGKTHSTGAAAKRDSEFLIVFEDAKGKQLARAPVRIRFYSPDRRWALFTQRLPYHRDTHRVVLRHGERELGTLVVPKSAPDFVLTHPLDQGEIDTKGVLHLRWHLEDAHTASKKANAVTYYVRYCAEGRQWYRPGVNLLGDSFDLDLRDMPGSDRCLVQVIATNGYQTSYVETFLLAIPRKPPMILLATPQGPLLFAQGFSREDGPLVSTSVEWVADGNRIVGTGASFDARHLRSMRQLAVRVTDSIGAVTLQPLGWYDGKTGHHAPSRPGY